MRLHDIAHARAGDKGTTSDITVIAYRAEDFELLRREVTADRVRAHFADIVRGEVQRFELPRLRALKFVLHNTLGGVTRTLDLDIHGKSLSSSLLELDVTDTAQQMAEMMRQFAAAGGMRPGAPTATVDDPFFTYDRPTEFDAHSETVNVPMRDGSYLVCDLLRPAGPGGQPAEGAFPGIVYDFNAYGARVVFASGAAPFVERGYVALVPSVRGSGDSPGHVEPFGVQEQEDGYDLVEWLAAQPFCTGRIGMQGISYGGHTTMLTAVQQPPHLTAIIPVQALSDWYENTIYHGGIYNARIRDWQQTTAPDTLETYPQHPLYDDFWRERSIRHRYDRLTVPVLDVGGWLDQYRQAMVENFRGDTWMVAGPWPHGMVPGQPEDIAFAGYLAWWDHWLADRPAPLPRSRVTSYEMPDHGWRHFDSWPPADAVSRQWFPGTDGSLTGGEPGIAEFDQDGGQLVFEARLAEDLVITGGLVATLRAGTTGPDGNIAVVLDDVDATGEAVRISQGWLKLSHRDGHDHLAAIQPGTLYDVTVPIWATHHRIVAGHTLRVTLSSEDHPQIDTERLPGRIRVELGGASVITASVLT
ncbi:CocE/NonD family hydrolase [Kutzneria chonburiensis]|uniref:CocE/NonD family hydrolase n=1 Tax=Kutzneria chonburiensis TaxID=1483604 RepID=A0ABV6N809_9PSEU